MPHWLFQDLIIIIIIIIIVVVIITIIIFQLPYHAFIAIFLVPSKNTRNKFTLIYCTLNHN